MFVVCVTCCVGVWFGLFVSGATVCVVVYLCFDWACWISCVELLVY